MAPGLSCGPVFCRHAWPAGVHCAWGPLGVAMTNLVTGLKAGQDEEEEEEEEAWEVPQGFCVAPHRGGGHLSWRPQPGRSHFYAPEPAGPQTEVGPPICWQLSAGMGALLQGRATPPHTPTCPFVPRG